MSNNFMPNYLLANMRTFLFFLLVFLLFSVGVCFAQTDSSIDTDLPNTPGVAMGIYRINTPEKKVAGFEDFDFFRLKKFPEQNLDKPEIDVEGRLSISGFIYTPDETLIKFERAWIQRTSTGEYEEIEWETASFNGVTYSFKGRFLEKKVQQQQGGAFTEITGVLTKNENGKVTTSPLLPFYNHAEM